MLFYDSTLLGFTLSKVHAAVRDNVPSVRSAACRTIGIISCFPQKSTILEDWLNRLYSSGEGIVDAQEKSVVDRKRVMIASTLQSLIEVYRENHQDAISLKFEELKKQYMKEL
ncbi:hypothetical protein VNO78_06593 [Psophocarpus tetragonolobus]|uniref:Uncharacterized protein n=1 Tax=Psophocarpus tetragonolobus TaxID=3891 RepID=A0AAN9STU4_PSOTE